MGEFECHRPDHEVAAGSEEHRRIPCFQSVDGARTGQPGGDGHHAVYRAELYADASGLFFEFNDARSRVSTQLQKNIDRNRLRRTGRAPRNLTAGYILKNTKKKLLRVFVFVSSPTVRGNQ